jgi:hypothetical protein
MVLVGGGVVRRMGPSGESRRISTGLPEANSPTKTSTVPPGATVPEPFTLKATRATQLHASPAGMTTAIAPATIPTIHF